MKKCPYCAEEIQDAAIVCRYCGRDLTATIQPAKPEAEPSPAPQPTPVIPLQAQPTTQPKAKPRIPFWLFVAGSLVVMCFCGSLLSSIRGNTDTESTATPEKVTTGANSVLVRTLTPSGTNTPNPTRTPTQELGETRDKPLPRDSVVDIGGDMQVMITNVQRPADDIIAQGNMFNDTPVPSVQEYMIVKLHVECKKSTNEKCSFSNYEFKTVGADGQVHDPASVAGLPQAFESFAEFFGGAALDGNIAFLVPEGDESVVLFYEPLFFGDPVYISLQP